jgi:hypothetical protein
MRKTDKKRMLTEIYYDMDERVSEVYNKFPGSFNELTSSQLVWQFFETLRKNEQGEACSLPVCITKIKKIGAFTNSDFLCLHSFFL